ncbi:hypothetical protein K2X85_18090 [bacterium]|nr:hypothetical protein [bacterium]
MSVSKRPGKMVRTKEEVARTLAKKHFEAEVGLQKIILLSGGNDAEATPTEPIKLLEVHADAVPSGLLPIAFGPSPASGVPYPTVILEVSPDEFKKIQSQELPLPRQWTLGTEFFRPTATSENS